jgi:excisionase family DNA binding protein
LIVIRIGQLAGQLGVHRNTIRNWIRKGRLPARAMSGKRYSLSEDDFSWICRELGIDRSVLKLKYAPGVPLVSREPDWHELNVRRLGMASGSFLARPSLESVCVTCGSCAGACPLSGTGGMDPRKMVRMAVLGLEDDILDSQWLWKCTLCGKCEKACPQNVAIVALVCRIRGLAEERKRQTGEGNPSSSPVLRSPSTA